MIYFPYKGKKLSIGLVIANFGIILNKNNIELPTTLKIGSTFKPEHMPLRVSITYVKPYKYNKEFICNESEKIQTRTVSLPMNEELSQCSNYFIKEIDYLTKIKVIVTLGKVAFDNCVKIYKKKFNINNKFEFKHGKKYLLPDNKILIACYHPSPRNVNTKVVTHAMINSLFKKAKKISKL